jgi:hypothetical protein
LVTGSYDVIATYPRTETVSVVSFEIVRLGSWEMLAGFRDALDMHAQAGITFAYGDDSMIAATLK